DVARETAVWPPRPANVSAPARAGVPGVPGTGAGATARCAAWAPAVPGLPGLHLGGRSNRAVEVAEAGEGGRVDRCRTLLVVVEVDEHGRVQAERVDHPPYPGAQRRPAVPRPGRGRALVQPQIAEVRRTPQRRH